MWLWIKKEDILWYIKYDLPMSPISAGSRPCPLSVPSLSSMFIWIKEHIADLLAQFGQHIFINKKGFMTIWALDNVECWNVEEVNCAPVISSMWTPQALQLLKIEKSCNVPDFSLVSQGSLYAIVHQFEGRFIQLCQSCSCTEFSWPLVKNITMLLAKTSGKM